MKKQSIIILFIAVSLLFAACTPAIAENPGTPNNNTSVTTNPPTSSSSPTQASDPPPTSSVPTQPTEPPATEPDPNALTADEIAQLQEIYTTPKYPNTTSFYNIALGQTYTDPREIDLYRFFYNGDYSEWTITEEESRFIKDTIPNAEYLDSFRSKPEEMDAILQMCFGMTLQDMKGHGLESFAYFENTGCYYNCASAPPSHADFIEITGGSHLEDGNLLIFYTANNEQQYVAKLKPVDGGYHILSNQRSST